MKTLLKGVKNRTNGKPHSRAELLAAHDRALKRMEKMTASEGFELLVKAGIYTRGGKLTRRYGGRAKNRPLAA
jgi:hypothetical protein